MKHTRVGGTDGGSSLGTVILVLRASLRSARTPVLTVPELLPPSLFKLARLLNLVVARHRVGARVRERKNLYDIVRNQCLAGRLWCSPLPVTVELGRRAGRRSAWGVRPSLAETGPTPPSWKP